MGAYSPIGDSNARQTKNCWRKTTAAEKDAVEINQQTGELKRGPIKEFDFEIENWREAQTPEYIFLSISLPTVDSEEWRTN